MNDKMKFRLIDILLIIGMILPLAAAMAVKILFTPYEEGIAVHGALVFFTIPMPLQELPIAESQINSWMLIISIFFFCLFMTHGTKEKPTRRDSISANGSWRRRTVSSAKTWENTSRASRLLSERFSRSPRSRVCCRCSDCTRRLLTSILLPAGRSWSSC